jgi:HSP20 family protein
MFIVPVSRRAVPSVRVFDRFFDDAFDRFFATPAPDDAPAARRPSLDVSETDSQYVVTLDVPGVTREDIQVAVEGRKVSIQAEAGSGAAKTEAAKGIPADAAPADQAPAAPAERVILRERSGASFARSFTLPVEVDQAASQAKLENGVLTLTLAKRSANVARLTVN